MSALLTGSQIMVDALRAQGVEHAFFLAGAPLIALEDGCQAAGISMIDTRHEQAAAMAAHAYSRVLRKPGVCMACSGPGTVNLASGIANAYADGAPVVAIGGSSSIVGAIGRGEFQEMDQVKLMRPVTRWATRITDPRRIPEVLDRAFGHAFGGQPGPVYVDLPSDVLYAQVPAAEVVSMPPSLELKRHRFQADPAQVQRAVEIIRSAKRPVIICGSGVHWSDAGAALNTLMEQTGIPVYTTPQSRGLVDEDHALSFVEARSAAFRQADLLLVVGTRINYMIGFAAAPRFNPQAKLIHVDISAEQFAKTRPLDVGLLGDARAVLQQLTEAWQRGSLDSLHYQEWTDELRDITRRKRQQADAVSKPDALIHPSQLCRALRDFMDRDGILCVDGHEILNFARQTIPTYIAGHRLNSGTFGTMGVGVPYGLGAKVAKPNTQVIVLHGDGSFGMNGMEMDTAVRHGLNIITVISNNGGWAAIGGGFTTGRDLGFTRYDKMAEALGCHGEYVEQAEDIGPALRRAKASGRPAVVNVKTDPNARSQTAKFGQYQV